MTMIKNVRDMDPAFRAASSYSGVRVDTRRRLEMELALGVRRASPGARADAAIPPTRPILLSLATIAGEAGRSLLLLSRRTTVCGARRARKTLFSF